MGSVSPLRKAAPSQEPPPRPIIVRKVVAAAHHAHHGGAWKIAYADFVTAMMAFFLLMWLLGMTDEEKRKGLADYFTPTLIEYRQSSAGSTGILGGDSIIADENYPHKAAQTGTRAIVVPRDVTGGTQELRPTEASEARLVEVQRSIERAIAADRAIAGLAGQVGFTRDETGLRIDLVERADFAMFTLGTARFEPRARRLVGAVARAVASQPGTLIVRGHTDALAFANGSSAGNWLLSAQRADATRQALLLEGVSQRRIARIEGVADSDPVNRSDPYDPRNRRISITLGR